MLKTRSSALIFLPFQLEEKNLKEFIEMRKTDFCQKVPKSKKDQEGETRKEGGKKFFLRFFSFLFVSSNKSRGKRHQPTTRRRKMPSTEKTRKPLTSQIKYLLKQTLSLQAPARLLAFCLRLEFVLWGFAYFGAKINTVEEKKLLPSRRESIVSS